MDDCDDIYEGFDDYNAVLDTFDLEHDLAFQHALKTSHGRRPPTRGLGHGFPTMPPKTATPFSTGNSSMRPLTAMRPAGYTSGKPDNWSFTSRASERIIIGGITGVNPVPATLEKKDMSSPQEKIKTLEKKIRHLIDDSCIALARHDYKRALEKAKIAARKERHLQKDIVAVNVATGQLDMKINRDLSFLVLFILANVYESNHMWNDALKTYNLLVKDPTLKNGVSLRLNMGNIFFKQGNFTKAIKMYQMALDQTPEVLLTLRTKIRHNIALACIKVAKFHEALIMFKQVMCDKPSFSAGLDLILAHVIDHDVEALRTGFDRMLNIRLHIDDEAYAPTEDKKMLKIQEVIRNDDLKQYELDMKFNAEAAIQLSCKVISPHIAEHFAEGFNWCMELVKATRYWDLVPNIEMAKALKHLAANEVEESIASLKEFEGKESRVAAAAANNLAFVYNVENQFKDGCRYAELSLMMDQYNPCAFVNKGVALYKMQDYERARAFFQEALHCDSSCYQALYNLGMCDKTLKLYDEAIKTFYKLHTILRTDPLVVYHLADSYDRNDDTVHAVDWFVKLKSMVPGDATIILRLGKMYDKARDKLQAFHYYYEAFQCDPTIPEIVAWLGNYYLESQFFEKAVPYFERLTFMQPSEVKWHLLIANNFRRSGQYARALNYYRETHRIFPRNLECLQFLYKLSYDQGLPEAEEYRNCIWELERKDPEEEETQASVAGLKKTAEQAVDVTYKDPVGPLPVRPKTAARPVTGILRNNESSTEVTELLP